MRMHHLIEACEQEVEEQFDLEELKGSLRGGFVRKPTPQEREAQKRKVDAEVALGAALRKANRDPNAKCPDGFRKNAKGKCQSIHSLERESSEKSAKAIKQYKSMPMASGAKKPSLVDRMKSMFGKK